MQSSLSCNFLQAGPVVMPGKEISNSKGFLFQSFIYSYKFDFFGWIVNMDIFIFFVLNESTEQNLRNYPPRAKYNHPKKGSSPEKTEIKLGPGSNFTWGPLNIIAPSTWVGRAEKGQNVRFHFTMCKAISSLTKLLSGYEYSISFELKSKWHSIYGKRSSQSGQYGFHMRLQQKHNPMSRKHWSGGFVNQIRLYPFRSHKRAPGFVQHRKW